MWTLCIYYLSFDNNKNVNQIFLPGQHTLQRRQLSTKRKSFHKTVGIKILREVNWGQPQGYVKTINIVWLLRDQTPFFASIFKIFLKVMEECAVHPSIFPPTPEHGPVT